MDGKLETDIPCTGVSYIVHDTLLADLVYVG